MDIYIVMDRDRVVGASARIQGAEAIRADEASSEAAEFTSSGVVSDREVYNRAYDRMMIVNTELRDMDD